MPDNKDLNKELNGPSKGEFIPPAELVVADERTDALPEQEDSKAVKIVS